MKTIEEIKASGRDPKNGHFLPTHGKTKTRLFNIWTGMKNRCYNPNKREFEKYGGRGITICEAWRTDFMAFYKWAIKNGYNDKLSIDRIDNDKEYSPENCRWADAETQTLNRSITKFIEIDGQKYTVPQLAKMFGINKDCLYSRARKNGYTSAILVKPTRNRGKHERT